jgi:hypothetical protein
MMNSTCVVLLAVSHMQEPKAGITAYVRLYMSSPIAVRISDASL